MQEHQVLTGSANAGNHCYSVGQVAQFTFWAYGSGCDLVISSSNQKPIQIISGKKNLISAVACSEFNGQIAVAYGREIVIYKPTHSAQFSTFSYKWKSHSSFILEPDDGNANILSWNADGDHMLVGSSIISLWSYSSSYIHRPTSVTFQLHENVTAQPEQDEMQSSTWKHLWNSGVKEHPVQLSFSPTKSHDQVFASVALGECMIKVWYSCHFPNSQTQHYNVISQPFVTDKVDFSFTYLLHPQPVTGFEWRKNFLLEGVERFSNVLISSSRDQICRIWVETKQPVSRLMRFQSGQEQDAKQKRRDANDKFKKAASTPMFTHNSESTFWNPLYRKSKHTKVRHFHIAATINPLSDIPILPSIAVMQSNQHMQNDQNFPIFTVHWLNNKFYQILLQYNDFVNNSGGTTNMNHNSTAFECEEPERKNQMGSNSVSVDFHNAEFIHNTSKKDLELSTGKIEKLVCSWQESRDALFSIHPSDGSLLIWHVDYLDEERAGLIRQPQVCFSSRIPMVFSSGDAATLCPHLILFVNQSSEQNLLHSASCMSFQSAVGDQEFEEALVYSDVKLLSKHNDGSLNLWQISFSDANDFSSITGISHSSRFCGHCFHMSGILSHPVLPLSVSTATHAVTPSSEQLSELILWRLDPVGPLSYSGGLSELARVSCQEDHLFAEVAWFTLLFPNWSLGVENKSPSTSLIALTKNQLQIYQVVVDASQILGDVMTPIPGVNSTQKLISQQSSVHPGCVLHLLTVKDEGHVWGKIIFLETFSESLFSDCPEETSKKYFSKYLKIFYVVMLEASTSGSFIHTWKVGFSANLVNVRGNRTKKTTVQMMDSSDEESEEEILAEIPATFSHVDVNVVKLSTQKLLPAYNVVGACSGSGKFNVFFTADQDEHLHPAPYHLCTISSNGSIDFWCCNVSEDKNDDQVLTCDWKLWKEAQSMDESIPESDAYHISVSGIPVLVKAASNALLACMCVNEKHNDGEVMLIVSIYECASSGGSCWKTQGIIKYFPSVKSMDAMTVSNLHLGWLSCEEGSFFLAVGYDSNIEIYSLAPRDMKSGTSSTLDKLTRQGTHSSLDVHTRQKIFTSSRNKSTEGMDNLLNSTMNCEQDCEYQWRLLRWTKLTELNIKTSKNFTYNDEVLDNRQVSSSPITVSWARDGVLIVATETEIHVFSQWISSQLPSQKCLSSSGNDSTVFISSPVSTKGLSEIAEKVCPSLLQYHPLVLSELMNSGHLDAVREILIHLAVCMNGDLYDNTCQQVSICLEKYEFCDQLSSLLQLCSGNRVTPFPLHKLVGLNGKVNSTFSSQKISGKKSEVKSMQAATKEPNLDDILAEDEKSLGNDDELDEILGLKPAHKEMKAPEHIDLSQFEPNYFGNDHCNVIHGFLTRNQLPGLTSLEQMELMALADTLANASNLKQEMTDDENSNTMGLSGNERGYAISGSGATALDTCGLRFIMAVHNHLCLLNSLPIPNRSALLKQGLSTCHFAWAFHSETEEEMLSQLPSVQRGAPEWAELRSFGAAWWIRSTQLLRRLVEKTARAAFLQKQDPLDSALYYLALNKKAVLCGLFRSVKDARMNTFFQHNFSEERWRRAALKNAFALMGKQRFHHATAFFLLSGSVQDAVKVCIDKLKDLQLAILIVRLREGTDISYHQLLLEYVLGAATEETNQADSKQLETDSFERSMAYWVLGKYDQALSTLLDDIQHEDISDVFNFYIFLRAHPIVLRNKAHGKELNSIEHVDQNGLLENANEQERHLIFQTAVVHLESGCPVLALDCLSKLPKFYSEKIKSENESMLPEDSDAKETVLEKNQPQHSVADEDWSRPVEFGADDELQLDWSEEEDEEESDDASRPTIKFEVSSSNVPTPVKMDEEECVGNVDNVEEQRRLLKQDVFAQHLRLTACFQIFVQELKAIANAYNTDGGQLRSKLYTWLENASTVLHQVFEWDNSESCSEGLNVKTNRADVDSSSETDDSIAGSLGAKVGSSQAPSLHELILADNQDWKKRRSALAARRRWLHCHHNFIRTLLSYCILHDSAYGTLATMRMELLLLLQESLQDKNTSHSLVSPLPSPSDSIPLVTSSIASCKTIVADPLTYLCHITRDILQATLHLEDPPHPHSQNNISHKCAILCSQSAALSTCIYQSLCDTSTPSARSQLLKADTLSLDGGLDENTLSSSPVSSIPTAHPSQTSTPSYVTSTTLPSQWPGVALLQSMLNCETTGDNRTKILVLLCESTIAIFFSLLIHSLQTHNTSLLYRLTVHPLDDKMWNAVFGGGVKIPIKYVKSSSNLKQLATKNVTKIRERMNYKLLSGSTDRKNSSISSSTGPDSLSYREKFVAPEIGLWDWLLTKPFQIPTREGESEYDSDADDECSDTSSLSEDQEDVEVFDERTKPRKSETDPDSYSWKIMQYVVLKLVAANFQSFIQLAGFDLAELNTSSPFLSAILRVLHGWQVKLGSTLDEADGPPDDYLPSADSSSMNPEFTSTSRPAVLRYQTMLEPNNTPFTEQTKQACGCRRLWQSLVKRESVQEIFIKYIFDKKTNLQTEADQVEQVAIQTTNSSSVSSVVEKKPFNQPVKILHKEHELISAFCINGVNSNCIALASAKDIQEIDVSELVASDSWTWLDESTPLNEKVSSGSKDDDFLFVAAPSRITRTSHGVFSPSSSIPWSSSSQTGQGANILMKRPCPGVRRMEAHPTLPYYLTGCRDGSLYMWEWGHQQHIHQFQQPAQSSKISNVHFSTLGNKVTSVDADGYLTMWQASAKRKPFFRHQVHDRRANDFCFISSSSVLATAGSSNNGKNVAVWDTLMPRKSILVKDFSVYEQSEASCIKYLSRYRTLLVGGKNGQLMTFDDRCLHGPLHKYAAHEVAVTCLAIDPNERFYVTGSSNGDIRLWDSLSHKLLYTSTYAHPRSSLFKNFGSGTVQVLVTEDHLLSCGADGSLKMKPLPNQDLLW